VPLSAEEAMAKIRVVSPTEREIPATAREAVIAELARAIREARGDAGPLRLFGVRPDRLLGALGLENGDRLEALGDKPLGTETEAKQALAAAKGVRALSLQVTRKGKPLTLVLQVK